MNALCSANGCVSWKAVLGHTLIMWTVALLLGARSCEATCLEQTAGSTFDITCICLNGDCKYSRIPYGDKQLPHCSCKTGMDVPQNNLDAVLKEMKSNGTSLESLYASGRNLTSLDPFVGHLKETMTGNFVLEFTSVSSVQLLDVFKDVHALVIQYNDALMEIPSFGNLVKVAELQIGSNEGLTSVAGFESLIEVGNIGIWHSENLANISGFGNLVKVENSMHIAHCRRLTSIPDFGELVEVGTKLFIYSTGLKNISGFGSIHTMRGKIDVGGNRALVSIHGFQNLSRVDKHLWVYGNPNLTDISGFQGLKEVQKEFVIFGNGLPSIGGLKNLVVIGALICADNPALTNFDGLENVNVVNGDLNVTGNTQLSNVDGLKNVKKVHGSINILSNNGLENIHGLRNVTLVEGNLTIRANVALEDVEGLKGLLNVTGDLVIKKNGNLKTINGLQNLEEVGRDLAISDNFQGDRRIMSFNEKGSSFAVARPPVMNDAALKYLKKVGGDLMLSDVELETTKGKYMPNLESIGGSLMLERNAFVDSTIMRKLELVLGSLRMIENKVPSGNLLHMFGNLKNVCANANLASVCGLEIKDNVGIERIDFFSSLSVLSGSVSVVNNIGLKEVTEFSNLKSVTKWNFENGDIGDLFGGFVIASNPSLTSLGGFESLTEVNGDLIISGNEALNRIDLENLSVVTNLTRITANGNLDDFASEEPLPYKEAGCRIRENAVPYAEDKDSNTLFVTLLHKDECKVERMIPTVVGFAIIWAMIILSMMLFYYMLSNFQSPYHPRRPMGELVAMFAAHLLALADVLSDVGFVITAFILWEDKSSESIEGGETIQNTNVGLLAILVLSVVVILGTKLYMIIAIFWGLMSRKVGSEIDSEVPISTLYKYLKGEKAMRKRDWLLLFPGLLVFDAEVVMHLPWGQELTSNDDKKTADKKAGFVHQHFARVAFLAALLEDLPQMVLQIAFMYAIEEDDGWAITGAMASLTLSVADILVKFVFPTLIKSIPARHLTRDPGFKSSVYDCSTRLLEEED